MDSCDILIVGGGPAGSSCAWKLRSAGLDVLVLDKRKFPRDKVCGGWITPAVLGELGIDPVEYSRGRVFQPITGFRTCRMGEAQVETRYAEPVSYGIRRYEFDHFLLQRSGARLLEGIPFTGLEKSGDRWTANGRVRTPLVIGAGGHFCPLARFLGAKLGKESIVAAQELELLMNKQQRAECSVQAEVPELFFCRDFKGYGWCFRKGDVLNVGLGRLDNHQLSGHVTRFISFLKKSERIPHDFPETLYGHAYLLYGGAPRQVVDNGILLVGDAAGLAYRQSGEGIRPAIESGILAARTIMQATGTYSQKRLARYPALLTARFGKAERDWARRLAQLVPDGLAGLVGGTLMATSWFARHIVLDRWFLHSLEKQMTNEATG